MECFYNGYLFVPIVYDGPFIRENANRAKPESAFQRLNTVTSGAAGSRTHADKLQASAYSLLTEN
jgi:hypothetical protein